MSETATHTGIPSHSLSQKERNLDGWRKMQLGDVVRFGNGKARPKTEGDFAVYGGNGILGYVSQSNYEGETIIIGRVGAYCGSVYFENGPIWISDNALSAKPKDNNDIKYLYFFLKNLNLNQIAQGSSHPLVTQTLLNSLDVSICDDEQEQKAIAEVLSSLDDKIDLLHRQNKTLEDMAQALFRKWFVEEADEGWEVERIEEVLRTELGGTPSTTKPEYWNGDIAWINSGEINKFRVSVPTKYITKLGLEKSATKLLPKGTTVIAITGATLGQISLLEIDSCANQSVIGIIPNEKLPREYVFLWVKNIIHSLVANQTGGAQQHINKNDINNALITIPPKDLMQDRIPAFKDYFDKISINTSQVRTLENLRDALLPKLMSGAVRVRGS